MSAPAKILITAGEPAGIGPEILVKLAQEDCPAELIACANGELLQETAHQLGVNLTLYPFDPANSRPHQAGELSLIDLPLASKVKTGVLDATNAAYVLQSLAIAADMALDARVDAILTGPVHKGIINQALTLLEQPNTASDKDFFSETFFSGHTEFFAEKAGADKVVMMLATEGLRVALATTHLPLSQVTASITDNLLTEVLTILVTEMQIKFGIKRPKIMVLGLNPHAGEDGHLGREELDIIIPCLERLKTQLNAELIGPIPADTAFKPTLIAEVDTVLAMYHDQGLPVLKHKGFGQAINLTLGLPFIRTSVDHGTGLDIAGQNRADIGSMRYALATTLQLVKQRKTASR